MIPIPPPSENNQPPINHRVTAILQTVTSLFQKILDLYLCTATYFNALTGVEHLVACGANVNCKLSEYGTTPLHIAAFRNHKAIAEFLVNRGAELLTENADGLRPFQLASDNTEVWEYLHIQENR